MLQSAKIELAEKNYSRAVDSLQALRSSAGVKNGIA
jgi:hypothetical protein